MGVAEGAPLANHYTGVMAAFSFWLIVVVTGLIGVALVIWVLLALSGRGETKEKDGL